MKLDKNKIQANHPSICYGCDNERRPAADENTAKGYVGCCMRVLRRPKDHEEINDGKEIGIGWVDLKANVFNKKSGVITNYQILTLEINHCNQFSPKT